MSLDAINWAGRQTVGRATTKAVLVALAHYANGKGLAWPSLAELAAFTEVHRRQLMREIVRLKRVLLIEDSGERRGRTKQIKVWKLALAQDSLALPSGKGDSRRALSGTKKGDSIGHSLNGSPRPERVTTGLTVPIGARKGDSHVTRNYQGTIVTNVTADEPAPDPIKTLFDLGVSLLVQCGQTEKAARSFLGKLRKGRSDGEVITALVDCRARAISNPVEWLSARLKSARFVSESGYEYRGSLEQIRREADKRRDMPTYWAVQIEIDREAKAREARQ